MFFKINQYCKELVGAFSLIPNSRRTVLASLSTYITRIYGQQAIPKLIVICTHNSRRSHLGQLWLAVGAEYYNLPKLETYSGGTEATALNARVINTLVEIGFGVDSEKTSSDNPIYKLNWTDEMNPYIAFSKKYDSPPNPTSNFGAIMVCSEADEGCPFIPGASFRLSLPFDDPKAFDDTALEAEKYAERCQQIAREMFYALSLVKNHQAVELTEMKGLK